MAILSVPVLKEYEWQKPVISVQSTPPSSPTRGNAYLVGSSATGAWVGQTGNIAVYVGSLSPSGWAFVQRKEGMVVYLKSVQKFIAYIGTSWVVTNIV